MRFRKGWRNWRARTESVSGRVIAGPPGAGEAEAVVELDAIENGNGLRDMDVIEIHATRSQLRML